MSSLKVLAFEASTRSLEMDFHSVVHNLIFLMEPAGILNLSLRQRCLTWELKILKIQVDSFLQHPKTWNDATSK